MSVKLTLVVVAELEDEDVQELSSLKQDLEGELVKVKSGAYENCFYGSIVDCKVEDDIVRPVEPSTEQHDNAAVN